LKDFKYSINIGIIGKKDSNKEIFVEFLQDRAIDTRKGADFSDFYLNIDEIPLKIKTFIYESFKDFSMDTFFDEFKGFDAIIIVLNLFNERSVELIDNIDYEEFCNKTNFSGISVLAGLNKYAFQQDNRLPEQKLNEFNLIQKTRELNIHYCFKIQNNQQDLSDVFNTIIRDILNKFRILNPEMYEQAKIIGKKN
jgi:hypothetical protein